MIVELHSWENFVMYPSRACTSVRPRQRATNMKSQTFLQEWRTKLHLWSLKSMLWSIVSCQNRVSADHYHMTVSAHRGYMIFEVIRWQVTSFQLIAGSTLSGSFSGFISVLFHLFSGTLTGQTPSSFSCNLLYLCPFLKPVPFPTAILFFSFEMSSTEMVVELHNWENLVIYPSRDCTFVRPRHRATNLKSQSCQQVWSLKSILWSIDSCKNRVNRWPVWQTVSTHRGYMFFEVIRWQVTSFQLIAGSTPKWQLHWVHLPLFQLFHCYLRFHYYYYHHH